MKSLFRTGLSLGTLVAPFLGGLFLFSMVGALVVTPPFNDTLGWVIAVDHGEARIAWKMQKVAGPSFKAEWQPATRVAILPRRTASASAPSVAVPLWMPFMAVAIPTCLLYRWHRRSVQREEGSLAAA